MPEFSSQKEIHWEMFVEEFDAQKNQYDIIIGRDLMRELRLDLLFSNGTMSWDGSQVSIKPEGSLSDLAQYRREYLYIEDPETSEKNSTDCGYEILCY